MISFSCISLSPKHFFFTLNTFLLPPYTYHREHLSASRSFINEIPTRAQTSLLAILSGTFPCYSYTVLFPVFLPTYCIHFISFLLAWVAFKSRNQETKQSASCRHTGTYLLAIRSHRCTAHETCYLISIIQYPFSNIHYPLSIQKWDTPSLWFSIGH